MATVWTRLHRCLPKKKDVNKTKPRQASCMPGFCLHFSVRCCLERNVVVLEVAHAAGSRLLGRGRASAARGRAAARLRLRAFAIATALAAAARAALAAAAEHLHLVGDDVGAVALDAFLVGVLVGAQA